jgi:AmmeMemoRadiSam system protein A
MLVYGVISPHPPIIIPSVGKGEEKKTRRTIEALEQTAEALAAARPDEIILIAPHEGHGFEVPMYYLSKDLRPDTIVQQILVTEPSYEYYFQFGKHFGEQASASPRRYAIVASGDLSHVLKAEGPYGYDPAGPKLDKLIVQAVRAANAAALLNIDPLILEAGAECGLRSILFLLGAMESTALRPQVLSYEGPFGVGYLVTSFEPKPIAVPGSDAYTALARSAIDHYLSTGRLLPAPNAPGAPLKKPDGAFVSLRRTDGSLRGCIGTTQPTKKSLASEIISNAAAAATLDGRFEPVTLGELPDLQVSVDVLTKPKPVRSIAGLNPKQDGLIVKAKDGRTGVLLPNIEGVDSTEKQIAICREKAGIADNETVALATFRVRRYEEPARAAASAQDGAIDH